MKRSAMLFACGQSGVIKRCLKPNSLVKFLNALLILMNAGPLSDLTSFGTPYELKISLSAFIAAADVKPRVYWSTG